jgi:hypothetical protein
MDASGRVDAPVTAEMCLSKERTRASGPTAEIVAMFGETIARIEMDDHLEPRTHQRAPAGEGGRWMLVEEVVEEKGCGRWEAVKGLSVPLRQMGLEQLTK